MKKLKSVLASVMAATISAVSLCSTFSVSAANTESVSTRYNVYVYRFSVPDNTYATWFHAYTAYTTDRCQYLWSGNGNLGGTFSAGDAATRANTEFYRATQIFYNNSNPNSDPGILGSVAYKVREDASLTMHLESLTNDRGNSLDVNTVKVYTDLMGDVNVDGKVDKNDSDLLSKYIAGIVQFSDYQKSLADVYRDGEVNTEDLINIIRYVEGISESVIG